MATLVKADGTCSEVLPANGKRFTLREMQEHVGGFIEYAETIAGERMVLDEEGKCKGKPVNEIATLRYKYGAVDPIVGDVLILTQAEQEQDDSDDAEEVEFEVVVGNIGTVYTGSDEAEALKHYDEYVEQSQSLVGRAGGEEVTLMKAGEPVREHYSLNACLGVED